MLLSPSLSQESAPTLRVLTCLETLDTNLCLTGEIGDLEGRVEVEREFKERENLALWVGGEERCGKNREGLETVVWEIWKGEG